MKQEICYSLPGVHPRDRAKIRNLEGQIGKLGDRADKVKGAEKRALLVKKGKVQKKLEALQNRIREKLPDSYDTPDGARRSEVVTAKTTKNAKEGGVDTHSSGGSEDPRYISSKGFQVNRTLWSSWSLRARLNSAFPAFATIFVKSETFSGIPSLNGAAMPPDVKALAEGIRSIRSQFTPRPNHLKNCSRRMDMLRSSPTPIMLHISELPP